MKEWNYTSTPPMGRTSFTEPQCLYSGAIPLLPLWAARPVQSPSASTKVHFTFYFFKPRFQPGSYRRTKQECLYTQWHAASRGLATKWQIRKMTCCCPVYIYCANYLSLRLRNVLSALSIICLTVTSSLSYMLRAAHKSQGSLKLSASM
jgi:hypothetical protein